MRNLKKEELIALKEECDDQVDKLEKQRDHDRSTESYIELHDLKKKKLKFKDQLDKLKNE